MIVLQLKHLPRGWLVCGFAFDVKVKFDILIWMRFVDVEC